MIATKAITTSVKHTARAIKAESPATPANAKNAATTPSTSIVNAHPNAFTRRGLVGGVGSDTGGLGVGGSGGVSSFIGEP